MKTLSQGWRCGSVDELIHCYYYYYYYYFKMLSGKQRSKHADIK